ncbi:hypothetical protein JB92DRAFT_3097175 [Gautieria morchelliformis]|nr:hypothetical protein JB92DRAFT_3097175 [Gautieria morchelliformis]
MQGRAPTEDEEQTVRASLLNGRKIQFRGHLYRDAARTIPRWAPESSRSLANPGSNESAGASRSQGTKTGNMVLTTQPRKAKQFVDFACELSILRPVMKYVTIDSIIVWMGIFRIVIVELLWMGAQ